MAEYSKLEYLELKSHKYKKNLDVGRIKLNEPIGFREEL